MAAEGFETTNLGWQSRQLLQRLSEWWEFQSSRLPDLRPDLSASPLPQWLSELLLALAKGLVWVVLAWFLIWAGLRLYRWVQPYLRGWQGQATQPSSRVIQTPDISTAAGWWRLAQTLQQQRNYREACRALYMALLQRLDESKLIRLQVGLTDGEYLQLVQTLPQAQACQLLITIHEQLCFSHTEISADTFQRCQQAYRDVEAQTQPRKPDL